jgi:hypothetical protein
MSAENPYPDHVFSYVDGTIMEPDAVYERMLGICEEDVALATLIREAANQYTMQIGLRNEGMSEDGQTRVYRDDPMTDYLRGVVMVRDALAMRYKTGGYDLPKIHPSIEASYLDTWLLDHSKLKNPINYPDRIRERLSSNGCDAALLETLSDTDRTWLERVGGLETMSLYALQVSRDERAS